MDQSKCNLKVNSPHVKYTEDAIETSYEYPVSNVVSQDEESGTIYVSWAVETRATAAAARMEKANVQINIDLFSFASRNKCKKLPPPPTSLFIDYYYYAHFSRAEHGDGWVM